MPRQEDDSRRADFKGLNLQNGPRSVDIQKSRRGRQSRRWMQGRDFRLYPELPESRAQAPSIIIVTYGTVAASTLCLRTAAFASPDSA